MSAMREWVREKAELSILILQKPNIDQILLSRLPDLRLKYDHLLCAYRCTNLTLRLRLAFAKCAAWIARKRLKDSR